MRTAVITKHAPAPMGPFSQAIISGDLVFVSAQLALDVRTNVLVIATIEEETTQVMKNIIAILAGAGLGAPNIVKASIFLKNMADYEVVNKVYSSFFELPYPARETFQVGALPRNVNVEISVIALTVPAHP